MSSRNVAHAAITVLTLAGSLILSLNISAQAQVCETRTGATQNQVVELYTSQGCSSCPPADKWLSGQKANALAHGAVVQSFHVSYWDYIGWKDRFATVANNERQRQIAAWNNTRQVYTPQIVRDGKSTQPFVLKRLDAPAQASIALTQVPKTKADTNISNAAGYTYGADVVPNNPNKPWAAYWTLTEDGHATKVKAGENSGELLKHDFVVRQYEAVAQKTGRGRLSFAALPKEAGAVTTQRVNLVVYDSRTGETLQAAALSCN